MKNRMFEAVSYVDDWYLDMVDTPPKEILPMKEKKHVSPRKFVSVLVAAVIFASILAVTAMAAGWIPNIFREVQEKYYPDSSADFEDAIQYVETQQPEMVEIPELDLTRFTLSESYYDGQKIMLGYNLDEVLPESIVGYEPDEELLAEIKGAPLDSDSNAPQEDVSIDSLLEQGCIDPFFYNRMLEDRSDYAKQADMRGYYSLLMDTLIQSILSPEQQVQFWQELEEKGHCCVVEYEVHIGDHKKVNGVDMFDTLTPENPSAGMYEYATDSGKFILLDPLPEEGQNQDSVTVELELRSSIQYYYMEKGGVSYHRGLPYLVKDMSFTLENANQIPTE